MAKSREKLKARELRQNGRSIKDIAKVLHVSVGSVSSWCDDIKLTEEQSSRLQLRVTDPSYGKKAAYIQKVKERTQRKIHELKFLGRKEIGNLTKREVFLVGVALYWGEGFKKDHQVGFATSDPRMGKFFVKWLESCFGIKKEQLIFRVTANGLYKDRIKDLEQFWSDQLDVSINHFSKPFFQNVKWQKSYENTSDYHGVIRIRVRKSMDFLRKITGYIEGVALNPTL